MLVQAVRFCTYLFGYCLIFNDCCLPYWVSNSSLRCVLSWVILYCWPIWLPVFPCYSCVVVWSSVYRSFGDFCLLPRAWTGSPSPLVLILVLECHPCSLGHISGLYIVISDDLLIWISFQLLASISWSFCLYLFLTLVQWFDMVSRLFGPCWNFWGVDLWCW